MTDIKLVTNADSGTDDIVGGDDWDALATLVNNQRQPYDYIVYLAGSTVKALSGTDGSLLTSNANLDPVLTTILALGAKSTYVNPGSYSIANSWAGWNINTSYTTVTFDPNAIVTVPVTHPAFCFKMKPPSGGNLGYSYVNGGFFTGGGAAARDWSFLVMEGSTASRGIIGSGCKDSVVWGAKNAIFLNVTNATGFVNGNDFQDLKAYDCVNCVEFDNTTNYAVDFNFFKNIDFQTSANVAYGYKNIAGDLNHFIHCKIWDINAVPAAISANITTDANKTVIIGGNMRAQNYADLGANTTVIDGDGLFAQTIRYADVGITNSDSPYTVLTRHDTIRANATSGAITITLPTAVGVAGKEYTIIRTDIIASTNMITIGTTSSQTIHGAPAHYLWPGEYCILRSDGANWFVRARTPISPIGWAFNKGTTAARAYPGGWITNAGVGNSTTSPAANTLWALPLFVSKVTKFDTLYFNITTGSSGVNARAGIYRDNGNTYPGALVFDTGSIDCTASGVKSTTITSGLQVLAPGLYWLAWECSAASLQMVVPTMTNGHLGILGTTTGINQVNAYGYSVAHTFGALPDPYTASASYLTGTPAVGVPIPAVYIRAI